MKRHMVVAYRHERRERRRRETVCLYYICTYLAAIAIGFSIVSAYWIVHELADARVAVFLDGTSNLGARELWVLVFHTRTDTHMYMHKMTLHRKHIDKMESVHLRARIAVGPHNTHTHTDRETMPEKKYERIFFVSVKGNVHFRRHMHRSCRNCHQYPFHPIRLARFHRR